MSDFAPMRVKARTRLWAEWDVRRRRGQELAVRNRGTKDARNVTVRVLRNGQVMVFNVGTVPAASTVGVLVPPGPVTVTVSWSTMEGLRRRRWGSSSL